jgi:peptide/nickel transport system substrate-binding protein
MATNGINLRYILRLTVAFLSRFKALIVIGIIFGIIFFFVLKFVLPLLTDSSTQKIGITGRYNTSNLPTEILELIGDGLTKLDASGQVEPNLASSWETPDKGKTWTFHIKEGVNWQDGKKVTSQSIFYQFSDVTIERPDDKTITFKLQNPYSAFPAVVSHPIFKKGLLGTGEWEVKKLSLTGAFVEAITLQNKDEGKIIFKFYPTEERTKLAFELGQVSKIKYIINTSPIDSWKNVDIKKDTNVGEYVAVFFNTQDKILAEKNLRQGLSYAINKDALGNARAIGPISMTSWAYNPQIKPYNYDIEKAKEVISDYKKESKSEIEITLTTAPILLPQAEKIAKDWEAAGVKVTLQVMTGLPSDYQALLAIFDIPDDPDQYSIWHSTQTATNITHYQNPRIDKLLEDGRSQIENSERKKIYFDFQRYLLEDSPAAFLYYPTNYTISRN